MRTQRIRFGIGILLLGALAAARAEAQPGTGDQACTGPLTDQLRRYSEQCLSDLIGYVAAQPVMGARVSGESDKYYVLVVKDAKGFRAEAVSRFTFR